MNHQSRSIFNETIYAIKKPVAKMKMTTAFVIAEVGEKPGAVMPNHRPYNIIHIDPIIVNIIVNISKIPLIIECLI